MKFKEWSIQEVQYGIVTNCNLMCRACSHATPLQKPYAVSVEDFKTNFSQLVKTMPDLDEISFTGGEPLLHPEIDTLLAVAKEISPKTKLEVITNGALLPRMNREFWTLVDKVYVSCYGGIDFNLSSPKGSKLEVIKRKTNNFFESLSLKRNENLPMVDYLWNHCWCRRGCIGILGDQFYLCMRDAYMSRALNNQTDGIPMKDLTEEKLIAYFKRQEPLEMCHYCTGGSGNSFPHAQVPDKIAWKATQNRDIKDMIKKDVLDKFGGGCSSIG